MKNIDRILTYGMVGLISIITGSVLVTDYNNSKRNELIRKSAYTLADTNYNGSLDKREVIQMAKDMGFLETLIGDTTETLNPETISFSDMQDINLMIRMAETERFVKYTKKFNGVP